jgi:hypothetical protein
MPASKMSQATSIYVIGLVNAQIAPRLVEECAEKGVRAIHFCTAGFSETGEEDRVKLESELVEVARRNGIRIIWDLTVWVSTALNRACLTVRLSPGKAAR